MGKRIVFADDESWLLTKYCEVLRSQGHHVECVGNAFDALEILEHEVVHLLVLDIILPRMSLERELLRGAQAVRQGPRGDQWVGVDIYREVRECHPNVRVVILSVLDEDTIRANDRSVEFDCIFLRKGDDWNYVCDTLFRLLEN